MYTVRTNISTDRVHCRVVGSFPCVVRSVGFNQRATRHASKRSDHTSDPKCGLSGRAADSRASTMQSTLVWQHPAFGDLFGRPLAASHYSEGAAQKSPALLKQLTSAFSNISLGSVTSVALSPSDAEEPPSTASKCLSTLVAALDFVAGMLPSSEAAAQAALRECSGLATHIADVSTIPPADATSRCRIVEAVVSRVRDLGSSGGIMPVESERGRSPPEAREN